MKNNINKLLAALMIASLAMPYTDAGLTAARRLFAATALRIKDTSRMGKFCAIATATGGTAGLTARAFWPFKQNEPKETIAKPSKRMDSCGALQLPYWFKPTRLEFDLGPNQDVSVSHVTSEKSPDIHDWHTDKVDSRLTLHVPQLSKCYISESVRNELPAVHVNCTKDKGKSFLLITAQGLKPGKLPYSIVDARDEGEALWPHTTIQRDW